MNYFFSYVISFFTDGILYIIILLPVYIFLRWLRLKKSIHSSISVPKEIVRAVFFVYLIMLFTQTFIINGGSHSIELIPFHIIIHQFKYCNTSYGLQAFVFNIIGNIGVFIPIGIILAYLFDSNIKKTVLHGCIISIFIEIVQIPLKRTTDIDDVILNTTGTIIGYFIYKIISIIIKKRTANK